jgi:hypothetical protein
MTVDEKIIARLRIASHRTPVVRSLLRRRARRAALVAQVSQLQADVDRLSERHGEQIARLEDLVRELVLTAESLRRSLSRERENGGG